MQFLKTDNAQHVDKPGPSRTNVSESEGREKKKKKNSPKLCCSGRADPAPGLSWPHLPGLTVIPLRCAEFSGSAAKSPPAAQAAITCSQLTSSPHPAPFARINPRPQLPLPSDTANADCTNRNSEALLIWLKRSSTESETVPTPSGTRRQAR